MSSPSSEDSRPSTFRDSRFEVIDEPPQPLPVAAPLPPGRRFTIPDAGDIGTIGDTNLDRSPYLARLDEDILKRTVQDCGLHAYGAIFVEVWVLASNGRYLSRPEGGHWMDPQFIHSIYPPKLAEEVDDNALDCPPGVSLAGTLYEETSQWSHWGINRKVYWRQIKSMADDPFIQDDGRLKALYRDLGIGFVATVPFYYQGRSGIVLFMNRNTCSVERLQSQANEHFLIAAADLIGAAYAIRGPRAELSAIRNELFQSAVKKLMKVIKMQKGRNFRSIVGAMKEMEGFNLSDSFAKSVYRLSHGDESKQQCDLCDESPHSWRHPVNRFKAYGRIGWSTISAIPARLSRQVINSIRKWSGAGMRAPARVSLLDCAIIFVMVTCTMLAILKMNVGCQNLTGDAHANSSRYPWSLNGGWYASTLCIVFALSSAPVGQPRQIIGAHIINALVGLAFQQIPTQPNIWDFSDYAATTGDREGLPLFWKESFAVGVGVAAQAWLGVMHPPATGLAFSFASGTQYQLSNLVIVILADLILVTLATAFLNLQEKKQYPMFWLGFSWDNPTGRVHEFIVKSSIFSSSFSERFKNASGRDKPHRDGNENMPQDRTPANTTTSSGVENV